LLQDWILNSKPSRLPFDKEKAERDAGYKSLGDLTKELQTTAGFLSG